LTITRLVNALNRAIQIGDKALSQQLLDQLEQIKGKEDPFVLKLAAYANIQQGELTLARDLLETTLAGQPDDLDAGLNMAVVEIRSGQIAEARRRLTRLLELYPDEGKVIRFLRQLPQRPDGMTGM
jgi:Tfp pilus assembly protein PilF